LPGLSGVETDPVLPESFLTARNLRIVLHLFPLPNLHSHPKNGRREEGQDSSGVRRYVPLAVVVVVVVVCSTALACIVDFLMGGVSAVSYPVPFAHDSWRSYIFSRPSLRPALLPLSVSSSWSRTRMRWQVALCMQATELALTRHAIIDQAGVVLPPPTRVSLMPSLAPTARRVLCRCGEETPPTSSVTSPPRP